MRLFFLDIDGTIAIPGAAPSPLLQQTIRALQAQGDKVFLCTGRPYIFIPKEVAALNCDGGIYSAGGRILAQGQEIFRAHMSDSTKTAVIQRLTQLGASYILECDSACYRGGVDLQRLLEQLDSGNGTHSELRRILTVFSKYLPIAQYTGEPVYKIVFFLPSREAAEQFHLNHPAETKVVFFRGNLPSARFHQGEISEARINKGDAMQRLCRFYGVTPENCVAYGDSMNDAEVLQSAGEGIAMGNANEEVKRIADRVCGSCAEDGLAIDLRRYIFQ